MVSLPQEDHNTGKLIFDQHRNSSKTDARFYFWKVSTTLTIAKILEQPNGKLCQIYKCTFSHVGLILVCQTKMIQASFYGAITG